MHMRFVLLCAPVALLAAWAQRAGVLRDDWLWTLQAAALGLGYGAYSLIVDWIADRAWKRFNHWRKARRTA